MQYIYICNIYILTLCIYVYAQGHQKLSSSLGTGGETQSTGLVPLGRSPMVLDLSLSARANHWASRREFGARGMVTHGIFGFLRDLTTTRSECELLVCMHLWFCCVVCLLAYLSISWFVDLLVCRLRMNTSTSCCWLYPIVFPLASRFGMCVHNLSQFQATTSKSSNNPAIFGCFIHVHSIKMLEMGMIS